MGKDPSRKTPRDMAAELADLMNQATLDDESPIDMVSLGKTNYVNFYAASGQHFFLEVLEVAES